MTHAIFAHMTASVTDLKKNPMGTVSAGNGASVAILIRNKPAFYCVPAPEYQAMVERLEDAELNVLADERADGPFFRVALSDLCA